MYHHSSRNDVSSELVLVSLVAALLIAWCAIRLLSFVVRTFVRHYKNMALWIALAVCVISCTVGILLAVRMYEGFFVLPVVGIGGFLVTCLIVSLRGRQTLLPENVNLISKVLHQSWWQEDTPLQPDSSTSLLAA